jgi:transcriptional regulator with XRE-family HTH domain
MSQDQLAAKLQTEGLGVNQNSISRIETGKRVVADYELKVLADVLNASVDDLLEEEIHL